MSALLRRVLGDRVMQSLVTYDSYTRFGHTTRDVMAWGVVWFVTAINCAIMLHWGVDIDNFVRPPWYMLLWCISWFYSSIRLVMFAGPTIAKPFVAIDVICFGIQLGQIYVNWKVDSTRALGLLVTVMMNVAAFLVKLLYFHCGDTTFADQVEMQPPQQKAVRATRTPLLAASRK